jgi:hypothetical protein
MRINSHWVGGDKRLGGTFGSGEARDRGQYTPSEGHLLMRWRCIIEEAGSHVKGDNFDNDFARFYLCAYTT